ncbi:MAG: GH92 family glycosyl hydrolase [Bacteroidaceae bacterium]
MKHLIHFFCIAFTVSTLFCSCTNKQSNNRYAQLVNPFIGTDYVGNTYPGAQVPFGMVQLSPDNGLPGWDRIAGYFYPDSTIAGFSHTHLSGTGAGDLYDISFFPTTTPLKVAEEPLGIYSKFAHSDEDAHAGYYRVLLQDYNVEVELTAALRTGIQQYTFHKTEGAAIRINLTKSMNWDSTQSASITPMSNNLLTGHRHSNGWARDQHLFFATQLSKPWDTIELDTTVLANDQISVDAVLHYNSLMPDEKVIVYTALSATSKEAALANLQADTKGHIGEFDSFVHLAENLWNTELSKIKVISDDHDKLVTFYTALYHTMLAPVVYDDQARTYRGPDAQTHKLSPNNLHHYSRFSLWDTYRAAQPLYTLLFPQRVGDMVASFVDFYKQHGRIPVWNMQGSETDMMIGYHSAPVIADAYLKGMRGFDPEEALEACVATANDDNYRGIGLYKKLGYMPYDLESESLSKTLEYAFDDYAIYRMAEAMGKDSLALVFKNRSESYKNLYNKETGFFQPRDSHGQFIESFDPKAYTEHITESNAWQYLWTVPQDVPDMITTFGGKEAFTAKLNDFFTLSSGKEEQLPLFSTGMIGQYAHGNEPSHQVAYLYNWTDDAAQGHKIIRQIMDDFYTNTPGGLCGNEDCGQMSAWYIFSAMGFYPVNPVGGTFELGIPYFDKMQVSLPNGKTLTIVQKKSTSNDEIKEVRLNNKLLSGHSITYQQIMKGGQLVFIR